MNVDILSLQTRYKGQEILLHPVLLTLDQKVLLVDCGYDESYEALVQCLQQQGIDPARLDGILVSHDDIDHIGALHRFRELNPTMRIYASAIEEPSLSGRIPSERLQQAARMFDQMPEEYKPWALDFQQSLRDIRRVPVDVLLEDNQSIEGEIQVIHTPGHTRGHLSFYLPGLKTLIASDAFVIENGAFEIANPQYTLDLPAAVASLRRLRTLDMETVVCYHGGVATEDIHGQLDALIRRYTVIDLR